MMPRRFPFACVTVVATLVWSGWSAANTAHAGDDEHDFPTDANELVIELGDGFIRISGDGHVYRWVQPDDFPVAPFRRGLMGLAPEAPSIAPPPPPSPLTVAQITPRGMQTMYDRADQLGLLDNELRPSPDFDWGVDVPATVLTIRIEDRTLEHVSPSLFDGQHHDPAELANVDTFVEELLDLESLVGETELSDPVPYLPERWLVGNGFSDPYSDLPTIRPWPLAEPPVVGDCVVLPSASGSDTATGGYSVDSGRIFYLAPAMPWDDC